MEKKDLEGTVRAYDNFSKPGPPQEKQAPAGSDFAVVSAYDNFSKPGTSHEKQAPAGSDVPLEGKEERIMEKKDLKGTEVRAYDNFSKPGPSH